LEKLFKFHQSLDLDETKPPVDALVAKVLLNATRELLTRIVRKRSHSLLDAFHQLQATYSLRTPHRLLLSETALPALINVKEPVPSGLGVRRSTFIGVITGRPPR
jgi:hypothetical protein